MRKLLFFLNGIIWGVPAITIPKTGILAWMSLDNTSPILIGVLAVLIFTGFHFMFTAIVTKNIRRIKELPEEKVNIPNMMPLRTWIVLVFMIGLGITLKKTGIAPVFFTAFFYCGLGFALAEAAIRYLLEAVVKSK
ncbi:MAG: hypothetical protein K5984_02845 [Bacteroidales bacterium]|nr:hypothetical protein [Bacteroidales bacterium]